MVSKALLLAVSALICGTAGAQVVYTQIPLNYNFHGMAHSAAITGTVDEYTTVGTNANADTLNGYRSIADRGLAFDPADQFSPAFYSGANIGATGISYAFFNTLGYGNTTATNPAANGLDCVHLGARCTGFAPATIWAYEAAVNTATNVGIEPAWSVCDQSQPQTTSFSSILMDGGTEIGVLYQISSGGGQFDVVLNFSDHASVTVRVAGPDWFGGTVANPAIVAGQPISSQKKLQYVTSGTTRTSFHGCDFNDAPRITTFSTTNAGPNLNVMEAVISIQQIALGDPSILGAHLTGMSFQNALYPTSGGRGYAVFAASVANGAVPNANCNTPTTVAAGDTAASNAHAFGATPTSCGTNDTSAVYFRYTAPNTGSVQARTCGTSLDTTIAIYSTCGGTALACNDNACGVGSAVIWSANAGQSYLIRVAGNNGATGSFTLHIEDPAHTDMPIPLNYNFHGMAHAFAITGVFDEYTTTAVNSAADNPNFYRSISDRGLVYDPANNHSIAYYSGQYMGSSSMQYSFFNTAGYSNTTGADPVLNGLDIVHLGSRCSGFAPATIFPYETSANAATSVGIAPAWGDCDHSVTQTTTFASGSVRMGASTLIGVLYHASNSGGQFDVTLNFSDHASIIARVAAPDWFGIPANPAIIADQPVSSQTKVAHSTSAGTFTSFQGCSNNDAPVIQTFSTTSAGPNLNVMEAIISVPLIVSGIGNRAADPTVVGAHLTSISFGNATYPTGGRGYAVFAATIRDASTACAADFNNDSVVDFFDYLDFVDAFSSNLPIADFNHDSVIDFFDYLDFVDAFSVGC